MLEWLPPGVELERDVTAADWVLSTLEPWGSYPIRLASFMPDGFEAFVRLPHPLEHPQPDGTSVWKTWAEIGSERGIGLTPDVSFFEIAGEDEEQHYIPRDFMYAEGEQPHALCARLVDMLTPFTSTPERCWFCVWAGELVGRRANLRSDGPKRVTRRLFREARREARRDQRRRNAIPMVEAGHQRNYLLLRGPIGTACSLRPWTPDRHLVARLWWPDDRAWIVVMEVDGFSTFVGGGRSTVDALLSSDLESIEVTRDAKMG